MRTALNGVLLLLLAAGVRAGDKAVSAPAARASGGPARSAAPAPIAGQIHDLVVTKGLTPRQAAALALALPQQALAQPGAVLSVDAKTGVASVAAPDGKVATQLDLSFAGREDRADAALVGELAAGLANAASEGDVESLLAKAYEKRASGSTAPLAAGKAAAAAPRSLLSRFVARPKAGEKAAPPAPASKILSEEKAEKWMLATALLNMIGLEGIMESAPYYFQSTFGAAGLGFINVLIPTVTLVAFLGAGFLAKSPMKLYLSANVVRVLSAVALIGFLVSLGGVVPAAVAGLNPLWIAAGLYALNLGMWRLAMPAETPILTGMIKDPARLEGYGALSQGLMQVVGLGMAALIGWFAPHFGYFPAMALQAFAGLGILAIMVTKIRPSLLASQAAAAAAAPAAQTKAEAPTPEMGVLRKLFASPMLGWTFLASILMLLPFNPILNQVIAPNYGAYAATVAAGSAIHFGTTLVSVFFAGNLLGFLVNWRESKLIQKFSKPAAERRAAAARAGLGGLWDRFVEKLDSLVLKAYLGKTVERHAENGQLSAAGKDGVVNDSLMMWLKLSPLALTAFAALVFPTPLLAYASMLLFGSVGIILVNKLRWFAVKQVPASQQGSLMALLIGTWTTVSIGVTYGLGKLFEAFPNGPQPFMWVGGAAAAMGLLTLFIRGRLAKALARA